MDSVVAFGQVNGDLAPTRNDGASHWLVLGVSFLSLVAFLYPILLPGFSRQTATTTGPHPIASPLILALVATVCLLVMVSQFGAAPESGSNPAKIAALLSAIVAIDSCLRLIPSFGGASPIFFLIILTGAVFGVRIGFLAGALTLLLSAFLTGGVGPWLPFQVIGAGWVGLAAAWVPRPRAMARRIAYLALYGAFSGLLYGALLSLYGWPFAAPGVQETSSLYWSPDLSWSETSSRYAAYYLLTSFGHDLMRAVGNAVLILTLGPPLLITLERARRRLAWQNPGYGHLALPAPSSPAELGGIS